MIALLDLVAKFGISSLLMMLLIFGFAPVFSLRLIVLLYPASDPRREELVAELYVQGRLERLLWVSEQIATALFEGTKERYRVRKIGRVGGLGVTIRGLSDDKVIIIRSTGSRLERSVIAKLEKSGEFKAGRVVTITSTNGAQDDIPENILRTMISSRSPQIRLNGDGKGFELSFPDRRGVVHPPRVIHRRRCDRDL